MHGETLKSLHRIL